MRSSVVGLRGSSSTSTSASSTRFHVIRSSRPDLSVSVTERSSAAVIVKRPSSVLSFGLRSPAAAAPSDCVSCRMRSMSVFWRCHSALRRGVLTASTSSASSWRPSSHWRLRIRSWAFSALARSASSNSAFGSSVGPALDGPSRGGAAPGTAEGDGALEVPGRPTVRTRVSMRTAYSVPARLAPAFASSVRAAARSCSLSAASMLDLKSASASALARFSRPSNPSSASLRKPGLVLRKAASSRVARPGLPSVNARPTSWPRRSKASVSSTDRM